MLSLHYNKLYFFPIKYNITNDIKKYNEDRLLFGFDEIQDDVSGSITQGKYKNQFYISIYINTEFHRECNDIEIASTAAHEALHVLQLVKEIIEDESVCQEYDAYMIGDLTSKIFKFIIISNDVIKTKINPWLN